MGSFSSALLCQRCSNGRSPILPLPPKPSSAGRTFEDEDEEEGAKWRCADCGYAVEAAFARAMAERLREELEAAKCEDPQVKYKDFLLRNGPILHPNHFLIVSCKISLFNLKASGGGGDGGEVNAAPLPPAAAAGDVCVQERLETVNLGLDVLRVADILEPGLSKLRGATLRHFRTFQRSVRVSRPLTKFPLTGKLLLSLAFILQQVLSQEVVSRLQWQQAQQQDLSEVLVPQPEMTEEQTRSAFRDALFCFEEAKKIQR